MSDQDTVDVLAICPHPDDAELGCAGLLLSAQERGGRIGVVDLSSGELGSRGTPETRAQESRRASEIMRLDVRINLGMPDGAIEATIAARTELVSVIRRLKPRIVVAPYWEDHHPDHSATSELAKAAWWYAGVTKHPGEGPPHRPERLLHYLGRFRFAPSLIVDVTSVFDRKRQAALCYASQIDATSVAGPETFLSRPDFLESWEGKHRYLGSLIGAEYGEGYLMRQPVPVFDPLTLAGDRRAVI